MVKDKLILVKPDFEDPDFPGQRFFCWHCALLEGVLASFPELLQHIEVQRIAWAKPRREVVELIGPGNQWLPVVVLSDDAPSIYQTGEYQGRRFVAGKDAILHMFSERFGIAVPHP